MSLSSKQMVFSKNVAKLIIYAEIIGVGLTFGEAYRTEYQEKEYVRTGKSHTMKSNHLRRLAVDFNFFINDKILYEHPLITKLGKYWESLNELNRWGGFWTSFKDRAHFEMNV